MSARGDTIIEVLLAVTVFSLVAVTAIVVMNHGTSSAQRSLEVTQVKQQIDAQAEALRAAHQEDLASRSQTGKPSADWAGIAALPDQGTIDVSGTTCPADFSNAFILNARTATLYNDTRIQTMDNASAPPYSKIVYQDKGMSNVISGVYGIWIEKSTDANFSPKAYDFRIRACWYGAGLAVPMQLETTVRLYDAS